MPTARQASKQLLEIPVAVFPDEMVFRDLPNVLPAFGPTFRAGIFAGLRWRCAHQGVKRGPA